MQKLVSTLLAVSLMIGVVLAGCQASQKPVPKTSQRPGVVKPRAPITGSMSDRVAAQAAKVKGVRRATVVVSANTAFVGLTLEPGISKSRTTAIKNEVARSVKRSEPALSTVNVTSDPDLVRRIVRISDGIKAGRPVSSFATELAEIGRRIVPQMR